MVIRDEVSDGQISSAVDEKEVFTPTARRAGSFKLKGAKCSSITYRTALIPESNSGASKTQSRFLREHLRHLRSSSVPGKHLLFRRRHFKQLHRPVSCLSGNQRACLRNHTTSYAVAVLFRSASATLLLLALRLNDAASDIIEVSEECWRYCISEDLKLVEKSIESITIARRLVTRACEEGVDRRPQREDAVNTNANYVVE